MQAINLRTGEERVYSHTSPRMALAQCYASQNNLNTEFASNPEGVAKRIEKSIREGKHGFHMQDWSIPKATIGARV